MSKWQRRLVVTAVLAALLSPAILDRDGFPLATYPMYANSRGDVVTVATANGLSSTGDQSRLSLQIIGNSDDPLIVSALVRDAVRAGQPDTGRLCQQIAGRAGDRQNTQDQNTQDQNTEDQNTEDQNRQDPNSDDQQSGDRHRFEQISIVSETHNVVDHAAGQPSLVSRQVHATCPVPS